MLCRGRCHLEANAQPDTVVKVLNEIHNQDYSKLLNLIIHNYYTLKEHF